LATDTERVTATLRVRASWEAIDLGARLLREWWRPVFGAWLLTVAPVAAALIWGLRDQPWLAFVLIWWLKPLWDRIPLLVLSEGLFGSTPGVGETLRRLPSALRPGLLTSLLPLRLSPLRALTLPVMQLEGQRGAARRERTRVLVGRESRTALGLHLVCMHLELLVWLGLGELVSLFASEYLGSQLGSVAAGEASFDPTALQVALWVVAMSLVEPFYVAGGFGLYLNRRIILEGWDIDLAFRRLARRARAWLAAAGVLALALVSTAPRAEPAETGAAAIRCELAEPANAKACVQSILDTPEFSTTLERSFWVPKGLLEDETEQSEATPGWIAALASIASSLANAVRVLAWVALALALTLIAIRVWRSAAWTRGASDASPEPSPVTSAIDALEQPIPGDVVGAARRAWADGDPARALSLLYRGALAHLERELELALPDSATEGECERAVRDAHGGAPGELSSDFSALVRAWQLCAYAHHEPERTIFEELCVCWQPRLRLERGDPRA
jgi:hypothetical protein